jgi:hypothetical protein
LEALSLVAEIAVGLAGFSGVAVVLGRGPGRWNAGDAARIRLLLGSAFAALFASLVPIGLVWTGMSEPLGVRIGAGVLLIALVLWSIGASRSVSRLSSEERAVFDPRVARFIQAVSFATMGAMVVVGAGLAGRAAAALFFLGLLLTLGYAAFGFARLLFVRPRAEREAIDSDPERTA